MGKDMKSRLSYLKRMVKKKIMQYTPRRVLVDRNYKKKIGRKPNLKNPKTFSDKLAWYLLYYRDERMRICTDKVSVRDYLKSIGMGYLLNECYGIYDRVEDIDWDSLPQKFVLKHNLSGEGKGIILVFDKNTLDLEKTKEILQLWIDSCPVKKARAGLWIFENRKAKILVEKLLIDDENGDLPDYKFLCFNGKVFCSYLIRNSSTKINRHDGELGILDRDFHLLPASNEDFHAITEQPEKPKNYEKMVEIAEKLSKPFPHVRVDLYNLDGKIIFGELTFFSNTGPNRHVPESFEYELGRQFILPKRNH